MYIYIYIYIYSVYRGTGWLEIGLDNMYTYIHTYICI